MKGSKRLNQIKEDNKKQLKKLFKYDKGNALSFNKKDREKVQDKFGVYVIFDNKTPIFVGQTGGYSTGYQPITKDLFNKMGQYNLKSGVGTTKFKKGLAQQKGLSEEDIKSITAEDYGLTFQYVNVKDEPAFINVLEILALEYAKDKGYELYNFN
ncbi:hypothetical protein ACUXIR_000820 [Staphylococcus hominis]